MVGFAGLPGAFGVEIAGIDLASTAEDEIDAMLAVFYRHQLGAHEGACFRHSDEGVGPDDPDARILRRVSVNGHSPLFSAAELCRGAAQLEKPAARGDGR